MIAIIDYGLGNLESVKYALDRLGVESALTSDAAEIAAAPGVILPGVGAFGRAMQKFRELKLVEATRQAAASGRPFMGICLGLQLLFSESAEHGRHEGLDLIGGKVVRFGGDLTVPHMGWNRVRPETPSPLLDGIDDDSFFYFAHSYYVAPDDPAVVIGSTDYGGRFASAVQKGNVFAVQFHPEKSGPVGLRMLENFCRICGLEPREQQ
jgi:glutamine amidotransferase